MSTCHNKNIIVKTTGVDTSSLNGKTEIPNKTLVDITRALLMISSHKKELFCLAYHSSIFLSRKTENRLSGDFLNSSVIYQYHHKDTSKSGV